MLGACEDNANNNACHMFVTLDALTFTNGVLITVRDFVGKDAITGEVEGRRGVSSISRSASPAVQRPSYQ